VLRRVVITLGAGLTAAVAAVLLLSAQRTAVQLASALGAGLLAGGIAWSSVSDDSPS